MTDVFMGLPVHALVVHAVVVLMPLSAIGLIAIVIVPRWRATFGWLVLAGLLIGTVSAFIAKQSGQSLADRVGLPQQHSSFGDKLPWLCLALFVVAAVWFWLQRADARAEGEGPRAVTRVLAVVSAVLALGAIALTIATGHTGAIAVWEGRVSSPEAAPSVSASPAASAVGAGITMADVEQHASATDCWAVVDGTVYNLTSWIGQHPGGSAVIEAICGTDATTAFRTQHAQQTEPNEQLQEFEIGALS